MEGDGWTVESDGIDNWNWMSRFGIRNVGSIWQIRLDVAWLCRGQGRAEGLRNWQHRKFNQQEGN